MNTTKTFSVAGIGFTEHDERIIKSVMRLSKGRSRCYALTDMSQREAAEILLINWDDQDSPAVCKDHQARRPEVPIVLVAKIPPGGSQYYCVGRPIVASRLIKILDQVTIQELKFAPELFITKGDNEQKSQKQRGDTSNKLEEVLIQKRKAFAEPHPYRALVVDDSQTVRKVIDLQLRMLGIQADLAGSAQDGFLLLQANTYDIILLDVMLPDSPGFQICKAIKKDPVTKKIPVIMLTGKSSTLDRLKGKFSGCDCYLTKPVDQNTFLRTVSKYLPVKQSKPTPPERPLAPLYQ